MDTNDREVWDRWLLKHSGEEFEDVYDFPVGNGRPVAPSATVWDRGLWQSLTVKRVDVVVHWNNSTWVVEVKPVLNMSGLGQVLGYTHLFRIDWPDVLRVTSVLVCGKTDPELESVYHENSVLVEVV